jgi:hypothetical protein
MERTIYRELSAEKTSANIYEQAVPNLSFGNMTINNFAILSQIILTNML